MLLLLGKHGLTQKYIWSNDRNKWEYKDTKILHGNPSK